MSKPTSDAWKDKFRDGLYASADLRSRKVHRDLLSYLAHRANRRNRLSWPSQKEIGPVLGCSVRNVRDLLAYLTEIGAIFPVPFSELPKREQKVIAELTPDKETRNAKAYYICEGWAVEQLAAEPMEEDAAPAEIPISPEARAAGREKTNSRRRRKAPFPSFDERVTETDPAFDDWQILNAGVVRTGSPTSAPNRGRTGSPTTDRTPDNNPAASSATLSAPSLDGFDPASSPANQLTTSISSLPSQHGESLPHGLSGGKAVASGSKAEGFGPAEGTRPEGTEYDAARAHERRAL
jgi:hypothetical protein